MEGEEEILSRFSAVILDAKGFLVTVGDTLKEDAVVLVQFMDGRRLEGRVVGTDPLTNVGVLKVDASDLVPVERGDGSPCPVGTTVYAVGNPFGLHHSVSMGIISGTDRTLSGRKHKLMRGFLQTTAPINPGDAGGLLADSRGRFVGLISSTFGRAPSYARVRKMLEGMFRQMNQDPEFRNLIRDISRLFFGEAFGSGGQDQLEKKLEELGEKLRDRFPKDASGLEREEHGPGFGAQGIHFALPASKVLDVADQIIRHGKVTRGRMGVRGLSLAGAPYHRRKYGVPKGVSGVLVASIDPDGPAGKAGIKRFDVIQVFAGKPVLDPVSMMEKVHATAPGTRVKIRIWRAGEEPREVEVVIEEMK